MGKVKTELMDYDVTSCSLVEKYQRFGETCYFQPQDRLKKEATVLRKMLVHLSPRLHDVTFEMTSYFTLGRRQYWTQYNFDDTDGK